MIKFENVSYAYPGGDLVLADVNFEIGHDESVGLVGANGAGKSTLVKSLLGLVTASGSISVDGMMLNRENLSAIRKIIGYVLQDSDNQMFMPTVLEDMIFGPVNYGMSREDAVKRAESTLERLNVSYLRDKSNHKLSGGEKRMAAIATILAMEPKYIIMDEPSASLDPRHRRKLINALNELKIAKVVVSHDLDMILETCNRVILLNDGRVVADGAVKEILTDRELLENNNLELPFCFTGERR